MFFLLQDGFTPLYVAAAEGRLECVRALITAAANINQAQKVRRV